MKQLLVGLIIAAAAAPSGHADLISNPVPDSSINVNADRTDWSGVTPYTSDPDDAAVGAVDFGTVFMAHDSANLYIRYTMYDGPGFNAAPWRYNLYLDIDQARNTGYIGGGSQFAVGADIMIQGASIYTFAGVNQTTFAWNYVAAANYNVQTNDIEMSFAQAQLAGLGTQFDWIALGDNFPNTDDYVPDGGNGGSGGAYHTYLIPEPGTAFLFVAGLGALALRRRARRA